MNRITPEQVVEAYEKTGIVPLRNEYCYVTDEMDKCGCALTALVSDKIGWQELYDTYRSGELGLSNFLAKKLDLDFDYISDFIYGFDEAPVPMRTEGYIDGKLAKELVGEKIGFKFEMRGN